jgi:hypothetical protein
VVPSKPNNFDLILVLESYQGPSPGCGILSRISFQGNRHTYKHVTSVGVGYHVLWYDVVGNHCILLLFITLFITHYMHTCGYKVDALNIQ